MCVCRIYEVDVISWQCMASRLSADCCCCCSFLCVCVQYVQRSGAFTINWNNFVADSQFNSQVLNIILSSLHICTERYFILCHGTKTFLQNCQLLWQTVVGRKELNRTETRKLPAQRNNAEKKRHNLLRIVKATVPIYDKAPSAACWQCFLMTNKHNVD